MSALFSASSLSLFVHALHTSLFGLLIQLHPQVGIRSEFPSALESSSIFSFDVPHFLRVKLSVLSLLILPFLAPIALHAPESTIVSLHLSFTFMSFDQGLLIVGHTLLECFTSAEHLISQN
jgi:hypothetical protein